MKNILMCLLIVSAVFVSAPKIHAWSDGVEGVLMPSPRGGGGISSGEAEGAIYSQEDSELSDPQVQVNVE